MVAYGVGLRLWATPVLSHSQLPNAVAPLVCGDPKVLGTVNPIRERRIEGLGRLSPSDERRSKTRLHTPAATTILRNAASGRKVDLSLDFNKRATSQTQGGY
jgi:hypothetical protein